MASRSAVADGIGTVNVTVNGQTLPVAITVTGTAQPRAFNFENDIVPLLGRFGCNSSGCHGKAEGQNGFKLSVFGFDPPADYAALIKEARGRRVFPRRCRSRACCCSRRAGGVPHGGGIRIRPRIRRVRHAPRLDRRRRCRSAMPTTPRVDSDPRRARASGVLDMRGRQQLRVDRPLHRRPRGRRHQHRQFQSNNEGLARSTPTGLVTAGDVPGEVAVMASYMGAVDVFRALVPRAETIANYPKLAREQLHRPARRMPS